MNECIEHNQGGGAQVYGKAWHGGKTIRMHRLVFLRTHGYLPPVVMHTCDNPRCINPEHLRPGTVALNNQDKANKGRCAKALPALRKMTDAQAAEARARYIPRHPEHGVRAMARQFGVCHMTVHRALRGDTYAILAPTPASPERK